MTTKETQNKSLGGFSLKILWLLLFAASIAVLLVLSPRRVGFGLLFCSLCLSGAALVYRRSNRPATDVTRWQQFLYRRRTTTMAPPATGLRAEPLLLQTVEMSLVIIAALAMTLPFWRPDPTTQLDGIEAQWLTSSAYVATETLHAEGYLPLWNPYNEKGEPLLDNPFSFVLNPVSMGPSLLLGDARQGIKTSVALYAVVAGMGGWFLGRMLGLSTFGRLLLAAMMIGKGNMVAMIGTGYYQLGVQQAYIPWIVGAAVALVRLPGRRWPLVSLAVALTLQFWAGNIWYSLPMVISVGAVVFLWRYGPDDSDETALAPRRLPTLLRLGGATLLTIGLSAASLLPIFLKRAYIGGHKPLIDAGETMPTIPTLWQFVAPTLTTFYEVPGLPEWFKPQFHYSFVVTWWFLLLIFVVIPPLWPLTGRGRIAGSRRLMLISLALLAVFTVWGLGGLQPFRWMYNNLPGIGRWRWVGRALGAASFWLAVLVALRADALWTALTNADGQSYRLPRWLAYPLVVVVVGAGAGTMAHSLKTWELFDGVDDDVYDLRAACVDWLEMTFDDPLVSVYQVDYKNVRRYYERGVRIFPIEADYFAIPVAYGYNDINLLTDSSPRYAIPGDGRSLASAQGRGYRYLDGSPPAYGNSGGEDTEVPPCAMMKASALPYAFITSPDHIRDNNDGLQVNAVEIPVLQRTNDQINVLARPSEDYEVSVVVSEVAYPGWRAYVDGQRVRLDPVGGYLGVSFPRSNADQVIAVRFTYRPTSFVIGAWTTLLTCVFCIGYLLRLDRWWPWPGRRT